MRLSPADQDKLLLSVAGMLARDRRERGVKLNQPEAVALLSCWVIERAREGRSVALGKARSRLGALGQRIPCRLSSITSSAFSAVTNSGPVGISSPAAGNRRWRARSASSTIGR